MKKIIIALLAATMAATMAFTMTACGGGENEIVTSDGKIESSAESNVESSTSNSIVFDEPIVVCDDEYVTVRVIKFYEEPIKWKYNDEETIEKCVQLEVENKTEETIYCLVIDGYIGSESKGIVNDGSKNIYPGKKLQFGIKVQNNTQPNPTPIESLDELYELECYMDVDRYEDDSLSDLSQVYFNLADSIKK